MLYTFLLLLVILFLAEYSTTATTIRLPIIKRSISSNRYEKRQNSNITTINPRPMIENTKLYNDEASEYLIRVGVGTPPQNFTLALDTGSSDLWIPSKECPSQSCPLARFDTNQSTTYKETNNPFKIIYGIGNASGTYARDTISVGQLQVQNQLFGLAKQTDDIVAPGLSSEDLQELTSQGAHVHKGDDMIDDRDEIANGIFGLGYPHLASSLSHNINKKNNTYTNDPFVFNLAKQGFIAEPIFSIYMGSMFDEGWVGEILFGGINQDMYQEPLIYAPVVSFEKNKSNAPHTYWMTHGQGIRVVHENQTRLTDHVFPEKHGFIIDTGTTLTYMDHAIANQVVQAAVGEHHVVLDDASGTYIVPCNMDSLSSHLQLFLIPEKQQNKTHNKNKRQEKNGKPKENSHDDDDDFILISVPMRDLVIPLDNDDLGKATQCMFGIAPWLPSDSETANQLGNQGFVLVGDTVLRSTYLVFDMGNDRIGFASARATGGYVTRESSNSIHNNNTNMGNHGNSGGSSVEKISSSSSSQGFLIKLSMSTIMSFIIIIISIENYLI
ncbi:hypothetical protein INT45_007222 [Circinella minor]|uniref:Mucorpepsin n=1 Tax=Circinella minor TaxID=1195481 RepID=A0A8H7RW03_9FUNG|nr:hypothetical protein INT45_007222 [Circinella minor]